MVKSSENLLPLMSRCVTWASSSISQSVSFLICNIRGLNYIPPKEPNGCPEYNTKPLYKFLNGRGKKQ